MNGFSFIDILDDAVERSGGQEVTAEVVYSARRSLRILTETWMARGFNTWRVEDMTVGSATETAESIDLPSSVDDIITVAARRAGGSETPIKRIGPSEYAALATKTSEGEPSQWWLRRSDPPRLYLYPIGPSELTIWYVRRPEAFDQYEDVTSDVPGRWMAAMVTGLALELARKRPKADVGYNEPLIQRLQQEYTFALDEAQRNDRHRNNFQYRIRR